MDEGVWILAEQSKGRIRPVSFELCRWGRGLADDLGCPLSAVLPAGEMPRERARALIHRGADRVYLARHPALERFLPEPYARVLVDLVRKEQPQILLTAATSTGRTLMPYVAAELETGLTADCTGLSIEEGTGHLLQTRPAIGGNIMATIKCAEKRPQMATVRPHSIPMPPADPGREGEIVTLEPTDEQVASRIRIEKAHEDAEREINLKDADVVVSVGRGVGREEEVELVRRLAEELDAALGASREVVDRGWLSYPHQVGLSGKTIRPTLYVAVGISGAIQHLAGMQTADCIVAINKDPDAPIFQVADLGVVGDLFDIVPPLIDKLRQEKGR